MKRLIRPDRELLLMRKFLSLLTVLASPALAQTPAGVINAPIYATGYISQAGGTNVTTNIPAQPNHPANQNIYTTGAISGTWTIKLPNPAFEGQMLSFNCGAAANVISVTSSDGSSIDSTLPTACSINSGFTIQFDQRSNIWRNIGSNNTSTFKPFTGVTSQWPWQLNADGTWTTKQPDAANVTFTQSGSSTAQTTSDKLKETVSVKDFGAVGNGSDEWPAFQKAINSVATSGGVVRVPAPQSTYKIAQALRIPSNVTVLVENPSTVINCSGDANYSDASVGLPAGASAVAVSRYPFSQGCVMLGSSDQTFTNFKLPAKNLNAVAAGDYNVTLTTLGDNSSFNALDQVWVEDSTTWVPFQVTGYVSVYANNYPKFAQFNRIVSIDRGTGVVTLQNPISQAIASPKLRNFTSTAGVQVQSFDFGTSPIPVTDSGVPFWTSSQAAVIGGTWGHANGMFAIGGGAINCTLAPSSVFMKYDAVSTKTLVGCKVDIPYASVGRHAARVALFSSGTIENFGYVVSNGIPNGEGGVDSVVRIGEGSNGNTVKVGSIHFSHARNNDVNDIQHGIHVHNASNNAVEVGNMTGKGVRYRAVYVETIPPYSGASYPQTIGNTISVANSSLTTQEMYAFIASRTDGSTNADSQSNVISGSFTGTITNGSGYSAILADYAGARNVLRNLTGANGTSYCDPSIDASNRVENVYLNGVNQYLSATCGAYATRVPQYVYSNAGAVLGNTKIVIGAQALTAGTATVTLSGASVFSGTYTYTCDATDPSGGVVGVSVSNQTASTFNLYGTGTHTLLWKCIGY